MTISNLTGASVNLVNPKYMDPLSGGPECSLHLEVSAHPWSGPLILAGFQVLGRARRDQKEPAAPSPLPPQLPKPAEELDVAEPRGQP